MILHKKNLNAIKSKSTAIIPDAAIFYLPEKVLQFGTGVLLRGLPDYFIDKANRQGIFNGRIVVVKSTGKGSCAEFNNQNSLYTICVRGIENNAAVAENIVCSSISRVLTAQSEWNMILEVAASADLQIVISNTTEVGIQLVDDNIFSIPPISFPGKLLAVLYHRYQTFNGDASKGLVIVPTELISDNGSQLKQVVNALARQNNLPVAFITWLFECNYFCNTLVDRIVPGKPENDLINNLEQQLGYQDELLIMAEVYKLWAIEGNDAVKKVLSFSQADEGVVITPDINIHKELKLRLLNGTHTLICAAAFLAGFETVKEAIEHKSIALFCNALMQDELAKAIPSPIAVHEAGVFCQKVLDRFKNPHIKHNWLAISLNYTLKLKMRVIPVLSTYFARYQSVPEHVAFGFAAYILFMRSVKHKEKYYGKHQDLMYLIDDEYAGYYAELWQNHSAEDLVKQVLSNSTIWGQDISLLPGFTLAVTHWLYIIEHEGVLKAIEKLNHKISA